MVTKKGKKSSGTIKDIPAKVLTGKKAKDVRGGMHCATGKHIPKVIITMRKAGPTQ